MSIRRLAPPDVQPASFAFSADNEARVAREIAKYPPGRQASAVISLLWIGQEQDGWVTHPMIEAVGLRLGMPFIRVLEVATFYTMLNLHPVGRYHLQVCTTPPCLLRGSDDVVKVCEKHIGKSQMTPTADGMLSWTEVECLGACTNAPMLQVGKDFYEDLDAASTQKLVEAFRAGKPLKPGPQTGSRVGSEPAGGRNTLLDRAIYTAQDAGDQAPPPKPPGAAT